MDILILGANGQLGQDCKEVLSGSYAVSGYDLPDLDISSRADVVEKLNRVEPEFLVNCAAYTAVDACEDDLTCWKVNAEAPGYLAEWAAQNGAFLVHISTDYVFDGEKPLFEAYRKADLPSPVSEYGRSKQAGEKAVLTSGADAAVLRTAWLYGAHGKNFLKTMLRLTLQDPKREIRVVNDQFGSPTWSHTLARQIKMVVEANAKGVFHAASTGYCSRYDLAKTFLEMMEVPHRIVPCTTAEYPTPAKRPVNSILENTALKKAGLNIFQSWQMELEYFVKEHREVLLKEAGSALS